MSLLLLGFSAQSKWRRLPNWYEAFDGTWTRFPGHLRRGREGHWRHAGSLTTAVPAALVLPRSGSSVDVDILVRQDITNAHASKLFFKSVQICHSATSA